MADKVPCSTRDEQLSLHRLGRPFKLCGVSMKSTPAATTCFKKQEQKDLYGVPSTDVFREMQLELVLELL